jgi:hypothetical protein
VDCVPRALAHRAAARCVCSVAVGCRCQRRAVSRSRCGAIILPESSDRRVAGRVSNTPRQQAAVSGQRQRQQRGRRRGSCSAKHCHIRVDGDALRLRCCCEGGAGGQGASTVRARRADVCASIACPSVLVSVTPTVDHFFVPLLYHLISFLSLSLSLSLTHSLSHTHSLSLSLLSSLFSLFLLSRVVLVRVH